MHYSNKSTAIVVHISLFTRKNPKNTNMQATIFFGSYNHNEGKSGRQKKFRISATKAKKYAQTSLINLFQ